MSKPVHQHFIPRSYLNNFATSSAEKHFIYGRKKDENEIIKLSTKNICVNKNLYTLPANDTTKKFSLEYFYADNVDSQFPEIYRTLANRNISSITFEMRLKIINTSLSLYFRTPKFLNRENKIIHSVITELAKKTEDETIKITLDSETLTINKSEANELIKEKQEHNRIQFLHQHLRAYEKFVQSKLLDKICVYHIADDSEFITSDNPVVIRPYANPSDPNFDHLAYANQEIDPFDSSNMIQLPIDTKTIFIILPNSEKELSETIERIDIEKVDVLMYNSETERYAEKWILGSENGIKNNDIDQKTFNEIRPENTKLIDEYQEKTLELHYLAVLANEHGFDSEPVKSKLAEMRMKPHINSDINFKNLLKRIEIRK